MIANVMSRLAAAAIATTLWIAPGFCQQMFIDTNGDGESTLSDGLQEKGVSRVDIWVETNFRDVMISAAAQVSNELLTINSYEFILRAEGGKVQWGKFTNLQPTMATQVGPFSNESDFYVGQFGLDRHPAGRYRLGTLEVSVLSGLPKIAFATSSSVWQGAATSFGSRCPGRRETNTLRYSPASLAGGSEEGDWSTAKGVEVDRKGSGAAALGLESGGNLGFATRVMRNAAGGAIEILVTTTRSGPLRIQLFDIAGRLAQIVADEAHVTSGEHRYTVRRTAGSAGRLAAGIYYYRIEASEGTRTGRLAIVR